MPNLLRLEGKPMIRVEVKNEILGDSVFWEGPAEKIEEIRNYPARDIARKVAQDGKPRKDGMWVVSAHCSWVETEDGQWATGCDHVFEFTAGGIAENGFKFCPWCGHQIHGWPSNS